MPRKRDIYLTAFDKISQSILKQLHSKFPFLYSKTIYYCYAMVFLTNLLDVMNVHVGVINRCLVQFLAMRNYDSPGCRLGTILNACTKKCVNLLNAPHTFILNVVRDIVIANNSPNTIKSIFIQKRTNKNIRIIRLLMNM